jgi:hypothetical protein
MTDGLLLRLRGTYPAETAWAPPWTGDELRRTRAAIWDAHLGALRATAEASAARRRGERKGARRQRSLAASYQAMHDAYRQRESALAVTVDDRTDWEHATRQQRQLAVAADAELRRRHPAEPWPPLRSAEPELESSASSEDPTATENTAATARLIEDLAARHREFTAMLAYRQAILIPAEDPDYEGITPAFPAWTPPARDAILQPPKPEIPSSWRILELAADRDLDREPAG